MKKFYVLAAAAAIAMSAAAQDKLYVVGQWEDANHFNGADQLVFEKTGDNFVFQIKALSAFKMSTVSLAKESVDEDNKPVMIDDWDNYNANAYGCDYGFQTDVEKELIHPYDGNIAAPYVSDYTVTVSGDLTTVKLTPAGPNPDGNFRVFFRGGMNEWGAPEEWEFKLIDEKNLIYKFECGEELSIAADSEFKIADANWGSINFGMPQKEGENGELENYQFFPLEESLVLVYNNNQNILLKEEFYGVAYFNLAEKMLYMSNEADAENPFAAVNEITVDDNAPAAYYTIQGVRVSEPANGLYIVVKDGKATKVIR